MSVSTCSSQGGLCLSADTCISEGGSLTGARCNSNPSSKPLHCCIPKNPIKKDRFLLAEQCNDVLGGTCTTGNICSRNGGVAVGTCWDGGITTAGVCCVQEDEVIELAQRLGPDQRQCQIYTFPEDEQIFCHECGRKYCSDHARNEAELTEVCGEETAPAGKRYSTECCYDADRDGECDEDKSPGYCCTRCAFNPRLGNTCP